LLALDRTHDDPIERLVAMTLWVMLYYGYSKQ